MPAEVRTVGLLAGSGLLAAVVLWLAHRALIDDAYITLAYAKNLATDLHWGLTPQQVSNSASSPANLLLLAAATAALRVTGGVHPVDALGAVSIGCALVMAWGWSRLVRALGLSWVAAVLGIALVWLNPIVLSAIGLEVLLISAVLVVLTVGAVERRPVLFGVAAGIALLVRIDLAVFVALLALATPIVRRLLVAVPVAAGVALPYYAWSWWYFGSAIPDTFIIKTLQRSFGGVSYAGGPAGFYEQLPDVTAVAFLPPLAGVAALLCWAVLAVVRRSPRVLTLAPVAVLGVGGVAYFAAYSALAVPPYHWYYVPPIAALVTFLAVAVGACLAPDRSRAARWAMVPAAAVPVALVVASVALVAGLGAPWRTTLVFGNQASAHDYAVVGTDLRSVEEPIQAFTEIGAPAYFCDCALVNDFTDRGVIAPLVDRRLADAGFVTRKLLQANYLLLDRDQRPLPIAWELRYTTDPAVVGTRVWRVYSSSGGVGYLALTPAP
ncbi:MAG: hypothetical protein M3R63_05115 [Actinomycetota bacterium]|nr:hypothetical protein [Actinomycetota bacterium]